jgi:hypothetical protein
VSTVAAIQPRLDRAQGIALVVGLIGLLACAGIARFEPVTFYPAYLVAYLFWVGLALGCVSITMLHHLVGGTWGLPIRRLLEAGSVSLLPMLLLFIPIGLGLKTLYPWARPEVVAHEETLRHKAMYLNANAFYIRAAANFAIWMLFAFLLRRWSIQQDGTADRAPTRRLQRLSGPGLAIVFLTATFAAVDWAMSLEPAWYSTIYGAMVIVGWGLETFAFVVLVAILLSRYEPISRVATPGILSDLGNLMLAFVMLWAYMAFSQFLIVWCGNLVEEIPWYLRRTRGGWEWVALALILFHFFVPFFFLLFRETKLRSQALFGVATGVVIMHLIDLCWLVLPAQSEDPLRPALHWASFAIVSLATLGVGGVWVWFFLWGLKGKSLIPLNSPEFDASHEHKAGN